MNTLKKIVSAVTVAATTIATLGTAAQAHDWNHGAGYGYGQGYNAPRAYYAPQPRPYYAQPQYGHRDHRGDRIATGVAIGVGALILGSVLASQANRNHGYPGY